MKKIVRLTESDLSGIIKRVIKEVESTTTSKKTGAFKACTSDVGCPPCYRCLNGGCTGAHMVPNSGVSGQQFIECQKKYISTK
jgi:hypothetical protein